MAIGQKWPGQGIWGAMALRVLGVFFLCSCTVALPAQSEEPRANLTVSPLGGVFSSNVTVTLSAKAGRIHYTLDGSEPTTNSPVYASPLLLTNSAVDRDRQASRY